MRKQKQAAVAEMAAPKTKRSERTVSDDVHVRLGDAPARGDRPVSAQSEAGRYVYGVIESRDPVNFGKIGIGGSGEQVYSVNHKDIAAVVSKTDVFIFDPTRENALAHEHVIETVMKSYTIIPMSFGTVFRTDD